MGRLTIARYLKAQIVAHDGTGNAEGVDSSASFAQWATVTVYEHASQWQKKDIF
jgi:hypothetical protein